MTPKPTRGDKLSKPMHITHPPIVTRHRMGLPTSQNRRKRARYWTPWHTATASLIVASVAAATFAVIKLSQP